MVIPPNRRKLKSWKNKIIEDNITIIDLSIFQNGFLTINKRLMVKIKK